MERIKRAEIANLKVEGMGKALQTPPMGEEWGIGTMEDLEVEDNLEVDDAEIYDLPSGYRSCYLETRSLNFHFPVSSRSVSQGGGRKLLHEGIISQRTTKIGRRKALNRLEQAFMYNRHPF
jgi:hypothetical protein